MFRVMSFAFQERRLHSFTVYQLCSVENCILFVGVAVFACFSVFCLFRTVFTVLSLLAGFSPLLLVRSEFLPLSLCVVGCMRMEIGCVRKRFSIYVCIY